MPGQPLLGQNAREEAPWIPGCSKIHGLDLVVLNLHTNYARRCISGLAEQQNILNQEPRSTIAYHQQSSAICLTSKHVGLIWQI